MIRPLDQISGEQTVPPPSKRKKIEFSFFDCIREDIIMQILSPSFIEGSSRIKYKMISTYKTELQSYIAVSKAWQRLCNQICFQLVNANEVPPMWIFKNDFQILTFLDQCGNSLENLYLDNQLIELKKKYGPPSSVSFWPTSNLNISDFLLRTPFLQKLSLNEIPKCLLKLEYTMNSLKDFSFYNLCSNNYKDLEWEFIGEILSKEEISLLGRCFPHVEKLSIGNPEMNDGFLECVTKSFVDLTDLRLGNKRHSYDAIVESIFRNDGAYYEQITSLTIYYADMTINGIQRISYCLPNLNSLNLSYPNGSTVIKIRVAGFSRLEHLKITELVPVTKKTLVELSRAQPQLKSLKLHGDDEFFKDNIDWTSTLPLFTELNTISIKGQKTLKRYLETTRLRTLENLTFIDCCLTEDEFKNITRTNPQLLKFEVRGN